MALKFTPLDAQRMLSVMQVAKATARLFTLLGFPKSAIQLPPTKLNTGLPNLEVLKLHLKGLIGKAIIQAALTTWFQILGELL